MPTEIEVPVLDWTPEMESELKRLTALKQEFYAAQRRALEAHLDGWYYRSMHVSDLAFQMVNNAETIVQLLTPYTQKGTVS